MLLIDEFRSNKPPLTWFKLEGLFEFLVVVGYHRTNDIASIPYTSHLERGGTILEFLKKLGMCINRTFHEQEGASGAFLSCVAESGTTSIHDSMVAVTLGRDNHNVLTTCLSRQGLAGIIMSKCLCGLGTASENYVFDDGRGGEQGSCLAVGNNYLKGLFGHASLPECFGKKPSYRRCNSGRL